MYKQEFLAQLRARLTGLPQEDVEERLSFYREMLDDRVEDGLSEEAAVAELGSVDQIVSQIVTEIPLSKLVRERMKPKQRLQVWVIILLVLGSPLWLSLLAAVIAIVLSVYAVLCAALISLWAVEAALIAAALSGTVAGVYFIFRGYFAQGVSLIGAGLVLAGLSILGFFGCGGATKGIFILTKKIALSIKSLFLRKENA